MYHIISNFLDHFDSPNTRAAYKRDLNQFFHFSKKFFQIDIENPNQISEKLILFWVKSMTQYTHATRHRKIESLSSFLKYLVRKKYLTQNPCDHILRPHLSKEGKTPVLTSQDRKTLLEKMKEKCEVSQEKSYRKYQKFFFQYCVVYSLLALGLRVSELCRLQVQNLVPHGKEHFAITFLAKGNEQHTVYLNIEHTDVMKKYVKEFCGFSRPEDPLFPSPSQRQASHKDAMKLGITRFQIYYLVRKACLEVGIDKKISPHSLRVTLATLLHQKKIPLRQIQSILNHKNISTTGRYVRVVSAAEESAGMHLDFFEE